MAAPSTAAIAIPLRFTRIIVFSSDLRLTQATSDANGVFTHRVSCANVTDEKDLSPVTGQHSWPQSRIDYETPGSISARPEAGPRGRGCVGRSVLLFKRSLFPG